MSLAQIYEVVTAENIGKYTKIIKSKMNQGLVCPFGLKLGQNVATVSMNPLEPLRTPKTNKNEKNQRFFNFPHPPPFPSDPPISPLGFNKTISAVGSASSAIYTGSANCLNPPSSCTLSYHGEGRPPPGGWGQGGPV